MALFVAIFSGETANSRRQADGFWLGGVACVLPAPTCHMLDILDGEQAAAGAAVTASVRAFRKLSFGSGLGFICIAEHLKPREEFKPFLFLFLSLGVWVSNGQAVAVALVLVPFPHRCCELVSLFCVQLMSGKVLGAF